MLSQLNASVRQRTTKVLKGESVLSEDQDWQRTLHGQFRTARREGWTRRPLSMTVLWRTDSARDRQALLLQAEAEGGTAQSVEDVQSYGEAYGDSDVAVRFSVAPKLADVDGLLLRARTLASQHRAELRSVGLGPG
jgi:hypothetical protein